MRGGGGRNGPIHWIGSLTRGRKDRVEQKRGHADAFSYITVETHVVFLWWRQHLGLAFYKLGLVANLDLLARDEREE